MIHFYKEIQGWFNYGDLYNQIISEMPENFKFAEIGVWKGKSISYFTVEAINSGKNCEIYAIDHFMGSTEHHQGRFGIDPNEVEGLYETFLKHTLPIKDKLKVLKMSSLEASKLFEKNSLDTVFIDASHDYQNVLNDLNLWAPKIKKENFRIYGHDTDWPGVNRAINEYSKTNNLKLEKVSNSSWKIYI